MKERKQSPLTRQLGLFSITNIVVANMVGAGIFTTSGLLLADLNDPLLMLLLWFIGGVIALAGALCYGEIGAAIPRAGGEYAFLTKLYNPRIGFLSGWVSFVVGFSAPIAASSIGFSEYLYAAVPAIFHFDFVSVGVAKKCYSIFIILVFTLIHLRGLQTGASVQNYLTILKIALLLFLIVGGFAVGQGEMSHFHQASGAEAWPGLKSTGLSLMWIMFAYSGWNASVYIGSEVKEPKKNIPRSLLLGTGLVMLLYLLLNTLFIYAIPPDDMKGVIAVGGLAMGNLFGSAGASLFSLLVAFALFFSISAFIILGPRVYFAMAEDGHFFRFASIVNPRYNVPTYSIIFQALISIVIILSGTFDQILTYMGFSLGIFPILTVVGLFILRKRKQSVLRLPGYPFTPIVFVAVWIFILVLSFLERPIASSVALATVLAGLPAYYLFGKSKKR